MYIETKNTLFVISLVVLVLLGAASTAVFLVYQHIQTQTDENLSRAHKLYTELQKQTFASLGSRAQSVASHTSLMAPVRQTAAGSLKTVLRELLSETGSDLMVLYTVNGTSGEAVARKPELTGANVTGSDVFQNLVMKTRNTKQVVFGYALIYDTLIQVAAVPIKNPDPSAVVNVLLLGKEFSEGDVQNLKRLLNTEIVLFKSSLLITNSLPGAASFVENLETGFNHKELTGFRLNGEYYYGRVFPIQETDGGKSVATILFASASAEEWATYSALFRNAGYASFLILLVAALIGIYISRFWLARPIKSLVKVSSAIGGGDLSVRASHENRSDELGELARAFNQMREKLLHAQKEEELSRSRFSDFAESSSDWLWETDKEGNFTYVSSSVTNTIGYMSDQMVGRNLVAMFGEATQDILRLHDPGSEHEALKDFEVWLTSLDGYRACLRLNGTPYYENDEFSGYRGTARDITKIKNDEERLIRLANKDHLSGLSNRRRFTEDLTREIEVAQRQNTSGAIALIDLDHFKLVNDTAGHAAGDEVIIQVAGLLRRLARNSDLVARLSGDEFVIAFINATYEQAQKRVAGILKELGQLKPTYGGKILNTSASVGIVLFPDHGDNPVDLLAKADTAMYSAKREGRNCAHLYSSDDHEQELMGSQLIWKERIHDALENNLFVLNFQPIAPTTGEAVSRYEVLVRMKTTDGSLHMPGSFIPTAEQFSLIQHIDRWVVRKAIRTLVKIKDENISFSINLSGLSVGDSAMMSLIESELKAVPIERSRVIFEVTESAAFQDINRAINFITRIKKLGCRIALDDFGVGFSSFSYLKQLQADILKIDGSFIRNINQSHEDQLFVKALVDVARGMGIMTVGEFVENAESFQMIRSLGVDYAQGHYIGKPVLNLFDERN